MPRTPPSFDDVTLGLLHAAARQADRTHRDSNTAFLDQFIRDVRVTTHRMHSAQTYLRVLAGAGIERLPSAGTVQRAISRARTVSTTPTAVTGPAMRAAEQHTLAQHVARVMALLSPDGMGISSPDYTGDHPFDAVDAYRRLQRLEIENRALRVHAEELTAMLMAARVALAEALGHHGVRAGTVRAAHGRRGSPIGESHEDD
ncbi:hypothetical protein [Pandoraea fibrosis]|uniref:Uncharacterized protein n=1 Tax=Pandoraea fibrosis TaxID=1891094 RepID=A0A5E4S750_9BURK|nr:hypothetical protein [Pandoraea fibrosis]VVD71400.1 hypothetical protein PFI31113_00626 [Pandoraea fibrosis]